MGIEPPQMVLQVYFTGSSTLIRFNYIVIIEDHHWEFHDPNWLDWKIIYYYGL